MASDRCKATVWDGGYHEYPCSNRAKTAAGFCKTHDPQCKEARRKKRGPTRFERELVAIKEGQAKREAAAERLIQLEARLEKYEELLRYWMKASASGQWEKTDVARAKTKAVLEEEGNDDHE